MPLVTISLIKGKSRAHIAAISDGIQRGLIEAFRAPATDKFQLVHQFEREDFIYDPDYLDIHRTDDLVIIHIVASNWRDTSQKKALYKAIADNLTEAPGLRPEDVIIVLSPNGRDGEDWSFGRGLASYLIDKP
ncbi:tautomerase family protein [Lichenihabitans sp. PAMC28606]|uniref:tautomerase family protein n=1 Tax=Lichenihabitans sp. PAMC28606 TaxID=2880932 RepID=UPI001D0A156B|nr:tautomerase family protein [Lichenihabitans sp. PAMC28606]UDL94396.1 tautomerase family protein [Lichenihabitans sp. PAMC28606]